MRLGFLFLLGLVVAGTAFADEPVRTGPAAFGDWRSDAPGVRRLITPADLPAPFATRSAANMSHLAVRTEADIPKAPPGFTVDLFASGLNAPRVIRIAPNGDIFVAETGAGRVRVFRPEGGSSVRLRARSSPRACSDHMGLLSTLQGRTRASSMSRRRTRSCAFPIAAER
jgi:glucose/arabinose dehydrogenase